MWHEKLEPDERRTLNMISGRLDLPRLEEYDNKAHFLNDVYSRIVEAGAVAGQLGRLLNSK